MCYLLLPPLHSSPHSVVLEAEVASFCFCEFSRQLSNPSSMRYPPERADFVLTLVAVRVIRDLPLRSRRKPFCGFWLLTLCAHPGHLNSNPANHSSRSRSLSKSMNNSVAFVSMEIRPPYVVSMLRHDGLANVHAKRVGRVHHSNNNVSQLLGYFLLRAIGAVGL